MHEQNKNHPDEASASNLNYWKRVGDPKLFDLVRYGTVEQISAEIEEMSIPNIDYIRDSRLNTLLHAATWNGNLGATEYLIQIGANSNAMNLDCEMPYIHGGNSYIDLGNPYMEQSKLWAIYHRYSESYSETAESEYTRKLCPPNDGEEELDSIRSPVEKGEMCLEQGMASDEGDSSSKTERESNAAIHAADEVGEDDESEIPNERIIERYHEEVVDAGEGPTPEDSCESFTAEEEVSDGTSAHASDLSHVSFASYRSWSLNKGAIPSECSDRAHEPWEIKILGRSAPYIYLDVDDLRSLTESIGVTYPPEEGMIHLPPYMLYRINTFCDIEERRLINKFTEVGNIEVLNFLLKFQGHILDWRGYYYRSTASVSAQCCKEYVCLLMLIKSDAYFPDYFQPSEIDDSVFGAQELKEFAYRRNELHKNIESGNLEAVMEATKFRNSSMYLNWNNESAICCCGRYRDYRALNMYAYFLYIDLNFSAEEDVTNHTNAEWNIIRNLTEEYVEQKRSIVDNLMASTKLLGMYDESTEKIVELVHRRLNECSSISKLMNVLEYEHYEAYFDFETESKQCTWLRKRENDRHGPWTPYRREIYIGAKKYIHANKGDELFNEFAGKLAHAICHMAMDVQYENNSSKPYRSNDEGRVKEFDEAVQEIKSKINNCPGEIHDLIKCVFEEQKSEDMHSELIAVVPQILAMYGEQKGGEILRSQVPKLYEIYKWQIVPQSVEYSQDEFFLYLLSQMKSEKILNNDDFMEKMNSRRYFLYDKLLNVRNYLNEHDNLSILVTTNVSLSRYLIYHTLKNKYSFHVDQICLFFDVGVFLKYCKLILNAYKCHFCKYLILYTDDKDVHFEDISPYFSNEFLGKENKPILILRSDCKYLKCEWNNNVMNYQWDNLPYYTKNFITRKKIYFHGDEIALGDFLMRSKYNYLHFSVDNYLKTQKCDNDIYQPEVLWYLMSHGHIVIDSLKNLCTSGNSMDTYRGYPQVIPRQVLNVTLKVGDYNSLRKLDDIPFLTRAEWILNNAIEGPYAKFEISRIHKDKVLKKIRKKECEMYCYDPITDEYYSSFPKEITLKIHSFIKSERAWHFQHFREHLFRRITGTWRESGELVPGNYKLKFLWASTISSSAFAGFLQMMNRVICIKAQNGSTEIENETSDEKKKSCLEEILEEKDFKGWTILHATSINRHENVLSQFLAFVEDILGVEKLWMHFTVKSNQEQTILHLCSMCDFYHLDCNRVLSILKVLSKICLQDKESLINLLEHSDFRGFNFLHYLVWNANEDVLDETLLHLTNGIEEEVLKSMLLHRNKEGMNVLQQASSNPDIKIFEKVLIHARRVMDESEFVDFVSGRDNKGNTIFHTRASVVSLIPFEDCFPLKTHRRDKVASVSALVSDLMVLDSCVNDKVEIQKLIMQTNDSGETFLNAYNTDLSMTIIFSAIYMIDVENLEGFLSMTDSNGNCYLHNMARYVCWIKQRRMRAVLLLLELYLPPQSFRRLLHMRNAEGESVFEIMRKTIESDDSIDCEITRRSCRLLRKKRYYRERGIRDRVKT